MKNPLPATALLTLAAWCNGGLAATVVEEHAARALIVVPAAAGPGGEAQAGVVAKSVADAAAELRTCIEKATGAALQVVAENRLSDDSGALTRIFVGRCQATNAAVKTADLPPEGFIIKVDGRNIYIVGGDRTKEGLAVTGTAYGCDAFLEKFVGVRWLMPGELGEVVPKTATLVVADTEIREEPLLWQRKLRDSELQAHRDRIPQILQGWGVSLPEWERTFAASTTAPWFRHQRLGSRVKLNYGHAYGGWWDRFHDQHPDIFARQPNGTRNTGGYREKLCVSNPQLWELVAQDRIRQLRADPFLTAASISPNDGGGSEHCNCEKCLAWDPKRPAKIADDDPDTVAQGGQHSLTDRHFRFYNEVGKRVAREMPDRFLGCYAYSVYRAPPVELDRLEKNLIVGFVGFNSYLNDGVRARDRADWIQWGRLANQLFVRPNLFWYGLGLPTNYVRKLALDLRFMAANGMRAADYDGLIGNWGTEGLNYYAAARLLWNPDTDVDGLIDDYCAAAYGRGAQAMRTYYTRLEALTNQIAAEGKFRNDSTASTRLNADKFVGYYTDELLGELRASTDQAAAAIGAADPKANARVKLVADGLDYVPHVRTLILAAAAVRNGTSTAADYQKVFEAENRYFGSLAMSWSVSMAHNYSYIRGALSLKPAR